MTGSPLFNNSTLDSIYSIFFSNPIDKVTEQTLFIDFASTLIIRNEINIQIHSDDIKNFVIEF